MVDDRPQDFVDGHLQSELLLSDFDQVGLELLDIDRLDFDLPFLEELELADICFKALLLLFAIDIEIREIVDDKVEYFEEPACLYEQREEDAYLFLSHFVHLIDDVGHLVHLLELLLKLIPVAVDVILLETVFVLHAFFEDLHESA